MITKRPIVQFIAAQPLGYAFMREKRPNLIFRLTRPSGLFRFIAVQRDGPSNALCMSVAATYNPTWAGENAAPLGRDAALAGLQHNSRCLEIGLLWDSYEPTPEGLHSLLIRLWDRFCHLAPPFFDDAERKLTSDPLLQAALAGARDIPAADRAGLNDALVAAGYRVALVNHPAFLRLREVIKSAWPLAPGDGQRGWTDRLAFDSLADIPADAQQ